MFATAAVCLPHACSILLGFCAVVYLVYFYKQMAQFYFVNDFWELLL